MKFHDMNTFLYENHKQAKLLGIMTSITLMNFGIAFKEEKHL